MRTNAPIIVLLCIAINYAAAVTRWTPHTLPNPMKTPASCGREKVPRSSICDPDRLLDESGKDVIEGLISMIYDGDQPFSPKTARYQVAVVVIGNMDVRYSSESFTRQVHDTWGVGDKYRNDGVMLFVSLYDREIYISVGDGVPAMTSWAISQIIERMKTPLREGRTTQAIENAVLHIGGVIADGTPSSISSSSTTTTTSTTQSSNSGVYFMLFVFIMFAFIGLIQSRKPSMEDRLKRLKQDVTAAHSNAYQATSCPICFEDFPTIALKDHPTYKDYFLMLSEGRDKEDAKQSFSQSFPDADANVLEMSGDTLVSAPQANDSTSAPAAPTTSHSPIGLPCGHVFCEVCLKEWISKHSTCPICRQECFPNDPQQPVSRSTPRTNLNFRTIFRTRPSMLSGNSRSNTSGGTSCATSPMTTFQQGPTVLPSTNPVGWTGYEQEFNYRLTRMRSMYGSDFDDAAQRNFSEAAAQGPAVFDTVVTTHLRTVAAAKGKKGSSSKSFGGGRSSRGGGGRF